MQVRDYVTEYRDTINSWLGARGLAPVRDSDLPALGFVVSDGDLTVACGFIRKVEGGFGLMDSLITNPDAPGSLRSAAIDLLTQHLLDRAKAEGLYKIVAMTVDANTTMRSKKFHFDILPHTVVAVDLGKPL